MRAFKFSLIVIFSFLLIGLASTSAVVAQETVENNTTTTSSDAPIQVEENKSTSTIGYWEGVWYNDSFSFDEDEEAYLDANDRVNLTKRAIARLEILRNSTFETRPPVNIVTREAYQRSSGGYTKNNGSKGRWNNIVWKSLFMVDENTNVENKLQELYGGQVKAFYSPSEDELYIIVKESQTDLVRFESTSLVHELVHAYQDQKYDIGSSSFSRQTQDGELAKNSIIEGEAMYMENKYKQYCDSGVWDCYESTEQSTTNSNSIHIGLQLTSYFPYSDGHAYVQHTLDNQGWDGVNKSYENIPTHSTQIIHYDHPTTTKTVTIEDNSGPNWETFSHGNSGKESVGEATLAIMFWYQDYNYGFNAGVDESDITPTNDVSRYNYEYNVTDGLESDAILPYAHERTNESGYIFVTEWNSSTEASQFENGYKEILQGHGAEKHTTDLPGTVYTIPNESGYSGVYYVTKSNKRLEVTHGESLDSIRDIQGIDNSSTQVIDDGKNVVQEHLSSIPLPTLIILISFILVGIGLFVKILVIDVRKR